MTRPPTSLTVLIDPWASKGCTVLTVFDPLLGKIVRNGPTRAAALATFADALWSTVVRGVTFNVERLLAAVASAPFAADAYTAALLDGLTPTAVAVEVVAPGVQSTL